MALCWIKNQTMGPQRLENRRSWRTFAWVAGGRDVATFPRLYNKVTRLTQCVFYTDDGNSFPKVVPKEPHIIEKLGTVIIEQDNGNTRHHLSRFARRTTVVSQKRSHGLWIHQAFRLPFRPRSLSTRSEKISPIFQ